MKTPQAIFRFPISWLENQEAWKRVMDKFGGDIDYSLLEDTRKAKGQGFIEVLIGGSNATFSEMKKGQLSFDEVDDKGQSRRKTLNLTHIRDIDVEKTTQA